MLNINYPFRMDEAPYVPVPYDIVWFKTLQGHYYVGMIKADTSHIICLGVHKRADGIVDKSVVNGFAGADFVVSLVTILAHYPKAVLELGEGVKL